MNKQLICQNFSPLKNNIDQQQILIDQKQADYPKIR